MLLILAAAAAAATPALLTADDATDLRCVYVLQGARSHIEGLSASDRLALTNLQMWFEGRLSARHPDLQVSSYVNEHFTAKQVPAGDADLKHCSDLVTTWEQDDLKGVPHKR